MRQGVALDVQLARIEHRRKLGSGVGAGALGHGQQQQAAVGLAEQAGLQYRLPAAECGGQIEPAEQGAVTGAMRHAAQRGAGRQQRLQAIEPGLAPGAWGRAQAGTA